MKFKSFFQKQKFLSKLQFPAVEKLLWALFGRKKLLMESGLTRKIRWNISRKVTIKLQLRRRPKNGDLHLEPTWHKYQKLQLCWFRRASSNNRIWQIRVKNLVECCQVHFRRHTAHQLKWSYPKLYGLCNFCQELLSAQSVTTEIISVETNSEEGSV